MARAVSVLLLGSGWTSRFLLPALKAEGLSYAFTKRSPAPTEPEEAIRFELAPPHDDDASAPDVSLFASLPAADMVVIVFPLTSAERVDRIVKTYESVTECQPAWLALGSTGAWSKGIINSSTPVLESSVRATSEAHLLSLHHSDSDRSRRTAVLNLAGLYGGGRDPANFAKKVGETREKLEQKTSLHLVHGKDVAQGIIGMYRALSRADQGSAWGKRWIVTDTHVYDWWQLCTTLQPAPESHFPAWVSELMQKYEIPSLPRPAITPQHGGGERNKAPYVLDRVLDGHSFWQALGRTPSVGRCDDYSAEGGGTALRKERSQTREAL